MATARAARRTDRASLLIAASADRLWRACFDAEELMRWLPPGEMTGRVLALEERVGGACHVVLSYPRPGKGKTTEGSDEVTGRFVALERPRRFVQEIDFRSEDPRFRGTMRMEWRFTPEAGGTRVSVMASDVPEGVSPEDHAAGLAATLAQLARLTEEPVPQG